MGKVLANDMEAFQRGAADVAFVDIGNQIQLHRGRNSVAGIGDGAKGSVNYTRDLQVGVVGAFQVSQLGVVAAGDGWELRDEVRRQDADLGAGISNSAGDRNFSGAGYCGEAKADIHSGVTTRSEFRAG